MPQIHVDEDDAFAGLRCMLRKIAGNRRLSFTWKCGGDEDDLARIIDVGKADPHAKCANGLREGRQRLHRREIAQDLALLSLLT